MVDLLTDEIFVTIKSVDGYEISNYGNVFSKKSGKFLKQQSQRGYCSVTIGGKVRSVHTLVWENFGDGTIVEFPNKIIDHIDRNPKNNNIKNLRISNIRKNAHNQKNNVKNICIYEKYGKFILSIRYNRRGYYFGTFSICEDAIAVRDHFFKIIEDNLDFVKFFNEYKYEKTKQNSLKINVL